MKATVVVYGSSTGTCESIAQTIAEKLGVEAIDAANLSADTIKAHDNLLLGTSTWGAGELQDDWYDALKRSRPRAWRARPWPSSAVATARPTATRSAEA